MGKYFKKNDDGTEVEVEAFEQVEVDTILKNRLDRETKKFADETTTIKTQLEDANKKVSDFNTEKKTLEEQLQSKDKEVTAAKLGAARVEIRTEFGIPKDLDKFLIGDTEEDIRANAEILKKNGSAGGVIIKKKDDGEAEESASKELAKGLFGSAKDE
jgi:hypothetical protein